MADMSDEITVKSEIMLLEDVLGEVASGRLRVPKFQRPFVWRPVQMLNLFDSIERGYPIGSLLVWDTHQQLSSLDSIADIEIPPAPQDRSVSYLLDGHQRLSTLFGSLSRRRQTESGGGQQNWMWDIYRKLGERVDSASRYQHWKFAKEPPADYLPMRAVLRTMDFLAYARRISAVASDSDTRLDFWVDEAEQIAQRIKSYKIVVIRLVGGELTHAVEVFSRFNSSGQPITPDQMVSALTYQADGRDSLTERIAMMQESLGDVGYGSIPSITIFQSILAVMGEKDVQLARWEVLARRVKGQLADAIAETDLALHRAVMFLRVEVGVPLARLVPYNAQVMLLVAFFGLKNEPSQEQVDTLRRWFWSTSWSGFFASATTTQIKSALQEMRNFANGDGKLNLAGQIARPFPNRFDLRSARIRALILWDLREFAARRDFDGNPIDAVRMLARSDTTAYRRVVTQGASISNPANRLILPTPPGVSLRRALLDISIQNEKIIESHGIPQRALFCLRDGDEEGFIKERAAYLANRERTFITELGVESSSEILGEADIDTE
ncbi:MAG: DUF262 domain-containing protein [Pseudonocardiaceae bacterium]